MLEPVSAVGSGDVLLAAFLRGGSRAGRSTRRCGSPVAAGAASTLEIGAGRFEPREAGRLVGGVEVAELEPVAHPPT